MHRPLRARSTVLLASAGLTTALTALLAAASGCSDDANTPPATPATPTSTVPTATPDAAPPPDAAPGVDGGADAASDGGGDASLPDAGPAQNGLFLHLGAKLYGVDVTTGALTEIGATGQEFIVLAWDDAAKVARVVLDPYSPAAGAGTPKLGTIDLCTGAVTPGPALTLDGVQVRRAEGLARDPGTGTFYLTFGTSNGGAATEFLSERNGTVDVATGAVTAIGTHQTLQDDGDTVFFVGNDLRLLDVAQGINQGAVYAIDKATGAATKVVDTGPTVLRIAPDTTRGLSYAAAGTANAATRSVGTVDLATGAYTRIGADFPANLATGLQVNGLLSAPKPVCAP